MKYYNMLLYLDIEVLQYMLEVTLKLTLKWL